MNDKLLMNRLRAKVNSTQSDLRRLDGALVGLASITEREKGRRKDLVTNLLGRVEQLSGKVSASSSEVAGFGTPTGGNAWGAPKETNDTRFLDNQGILKMQQDTMTQQDQDLGSLSQSIAVQKQLALAIGNEVEEQNVLLDDLEDDVDRVGGRLRKVNKATQRLAKMSRGRKGSCVVFMLFIIMLVLLMWKLQN